MWVARSHQPLNSHNWLVPPFCSFPFLSPFQLSTKLTPSSNYLFLIGHNFAASKIEHFWHQTHVCNLGISYCDWYELLALQDSALHLSPVLPFNSLKNFFSHNSPDHLWNPTRPHNTICNFCQIFSLLAKQLKVPGDGSGTEVWIVIGWNVSRQAADPNQQDQLTFPTELVLFL